MTGMYVIDREPDHGVVTRRYWWGEHYYVGIDSGGYLYVEKFFFPYGVPHSSFPNRVKHGFTAGLVKLKPKDNG